MSLNQSNSPALVYSRLLKLFSALSERKKIIVIRKLRKRLARAKGYFYQRAGCGQVGSPYGDMHVARTRKNARSQYSRLSGERLSSRGECALRAKQSARPLFRRADVIGSENFLKVVFRSRFRGDIRYRGPDFLSVSGLVLNQK